MPKTTKKVKTMTYDNYTAEDADRDSEEFNNYCCSDSRPKSFGDDGQLNAVLSQICNIASTGGTYLIYIREIRPGVL